MQHVTLTIFAFSFLGLVVQTANAQSGTRIYTQPGSGTTYPQGTVIQGGSSTIQGSTIRQGSSAMNRGSATMAPAETFESKFWRFLKGANYTQWAPAPGKNDDTYAGESPHGAYLRMYLNRKAAGRPDELPVGSVIVKENYGPDQKTLAAVTVMYRAADYDPMNGNWYWIKYNPDGSVASKNGKRLGGRVGGCIECHSSAGGDDYVFAND